MNADDPTQVTPPPVPADARDDAPAAVSPPPQPPPLPPEALAPRPNARDDADAANDADDADDADDANDDADDANDDAAPRAATSDADANDGMQACPSCGLLNDAALAYCTGCGAPLFDATEIAQVGSDDLPRVAAAWRVYGVQTETIGREDDLAALVDSFRDAIHAQTCVTLTLTGPAGIGKSRLVGELNAQLDNLFARAHLVAGAARAASEAPYGAIGRLIKNRFYIPSEEQGASGRRKLTQGIKAIVRNPLSAEIAELVGYLIGLPFPDSHVYDRYHNDPARILDKARHALVQLIERDASRQPLILVLDDLHLASDETLDLIRDLHDRLATSPVLLLCVTDDTLEDRAPWLFARHDAPAETPDAPTPAPAADTPEAAPDADPSAPTPQPQPQRRRLLRLNPLSDDDTTELIHHILRRVDGDLPDALVARICTHAFGNPMTVEAIIQILIGHGVIDTRGNTWTLRPERLDSVTLPNTFEGLVQARIDALSDEERQTLAWAAVFGGAFWPHGVLALARASTPIDDVDPSWPWPGDAQRDRLLELLDVLQRKDILDALVADSSLPDHAELVFRHEVERRALYQRLDPDALPRLHALAAQWLDRACQNTDARDLHIEAIAHHYDLGGCPHRAALAWLDAGRKAAAHYLGPLAVKHLHKALDRLGDGDLLHRIDALHDLASVHDLMGEAEASAPHLHELLRLAWALDHKAKVAVGYNKLGRMHRALGRYDLALDQLRRAQTLFEAIDDQVGVAASLDDIGKVHTIRGDYPQAEACYKRALTLRRQLGDPRSEAVTLNSLGTVKLSRGQFKEALILLRQALDLRKQVGDRRGLAETLNGLAALCHQRGDLGQAAALYTEVQKVASDIGDRVMLGIVLNNRGELNLARGHLDDARADLDQAIALTRDSGERRVLFDALKNLGQLQRKLGHWERAVELTEEALDIARALRAQVLIGIALRCIGELHADTLFGEDDHDTLDRAEACFRESIRILEEVGHEAELGHSLSSWGNYLLERGQVIQGKQRLEQARAIFERLSMKRVLQKTEQTIGEL